MAVLKFEDALGRLETIVQTLERGELSLDESLKAFEEGVKLSKSCLKLLDDAERRVDILLGERGRKKIQPFPTDDDAADTETADAGDER
jgi:exodeoxyribonuclease VII small subunit